MDSVDVATTSAIHVVALPYPARGHINPMMNICNLLASEEGLIVTFVLTEEWVGFIGSAQTAPNIRLRSIPNVIPSELVRGADLPGFVEAVYTKMEAPFERLLQRLEPQPNFLVADTFLSWAVTVGNRKKIPVVSLWPMSPTVFSIYYHFDLLASNHHLSADISERGAELIDYIPGVSSIHLGDLPSICSNKDDRIWRMVFEAFAWVTKAHCLVLTSFHELEAHATDTLRAQLPFPVYTLGPAIPHMTLQDMPPKALDYISWLDSRPRSSVIYISLGSFLSVSGPQMEEIANGLRVSGAHFLWVTRGDTSRILDMCGGDHMGLVVPWCDQLRVLCHSSIGGFLTHCGWNSTLEAVYAGVPMLTFSLLVDQPTNSKLIVDDWKVGLRVRKEVGEENVVSRDEIAGIVKRLMDLDGDESRELRRRARELQKTCKSALEKGGSSNTNRNAFLLEMCKASTIRPNN